MAEARNVLLQLTVCEAPVFIIGSPRSGTTALAQALAQHSQLWTSGELQLLWRLYGNGVEDKIARELLYPGWLHNEGVSREEVLRHLGLGLNVLFSSRSHGRRWIEQSPVNTHMTHILADMFPGSRFVHILRDGRAVVNSMVNMRRSQTDDVYDAVVRSGSYPQWAGNFAKACEEWTRSVAAATEFGDAHTDRYLLVRYEDLNANAEEAFAALLDFLGCPPEPEPLWYWRSARIHSSFGSADVRPIDPSSTWSQEQRGTFGTVAGEMMSRHGYNWPSGAAAQC
jgi:hypothetical protein